MRAPSPLTAYVYKHILSYVGGLPPTLVPPAVRGLTELFLVVENLAQVWQTACFYKCTLEESIYRKSFSLSALQEWGIAEDLIVGLTTDDALRRCFTQVRQQFRGHRIVI